MNRAVNAPAAEQRFVRRVYNRVNVQFCDIALNYSDSVHLNISSFIINEKYMVVARSGAAICQSNFRYQICENCLRAMRFASRLSEGRRFNRNDYSFQSSTCAF